MWIPILVIVLVLAMTNLLVLIVRWPSVASPSTTSSSFHSQTASVISSLFGVTDGAGYLLDHPKIIDMAVPDGPHESVQGKPRPENDKADGSGVSHRSGERNDSTGRPLGVEATPTEKPVEAGQSEQKNNSTHGTISNNSNTNAVDDVNRTVDDGSEDSELFLNDTLLPKPGNEARDANGNFGYVADPQAVRKGVAGSLERVGFWKTLTEYATSYGEGALYHDADLSVRSVCDIGPGRSFEEDAGFKLLTEKIQVYNSTKENSPRPRIFCAMYSYGKMRNLVRAQALLWGHMCDGFLAFSTETIPELGIVDSVHFGREEYHNMWQKVRSIWYYIYLHYRDDYDYFHLSGDDMYMLVPNMRKFLVEQDRAASASNKAIPDNVNPTEKLRRQARFYGQEVSFGGNKKVVAGGPGYTLNSAALAYFVNNILPICRTTIHVSAEDRIISRCFEEHNIRVSDTREVETAESRYHVTGASSLYNYRTIGTPGGRLSYYGKQAKYWRTMPHPMNSSEPTGSRYGMETASRYSVNLHDVYHPIFAARIHALLYPETCPADSVLGRALRQRLGF